MFIDSLFPFARAETAAAMGPSPSTSPSAPTVPWGGLRPSARPDRMGVRRACARPRCRGDGIAYGGRRGPGGHREGALNAADQSAGALAGWQALDVPAGRVAMFAHGTTVATNALLERRGGRTAVVTTEGFGDLIEIGRQDRASLYDLTRHRPPPLVPRELRFVVRERMGPGGVVVPLDAASLEVAVEAVAAAEVEAVAVCLLFGFLHAEHERQVGEALRARLPDVPVSLSCEVLPEFREYERMSTTVADAYLRPRLGSYLARLGRRSARAGLPVPLVMQSSGSRGAVGHPAR